MNRTASNVDLHDEVMTNIKVLVVDDENAIRRFLRTSLTAYGYSIVEADTGEDALFQVAIAQPDLIILDLDLPDMSGIEVTQRIREWSQIPIVVLSVLDRDVNKIEALDSGADDYLTKPFSVGELMARLRVAMRHAQQSDSQPIFEANGLVIDLAARTVERNKEEIQLTPTEYDILRVLVRYAGRVLTHQQLLREVRGAGFQAETHLLRVHMSNLRRKIEIDPTNPQFIMTEPGVGYRLVVEN